MTSKSTRRLKADTYNFNTNTLEMRLGRQMEKGQIAKKKKKKHETK